jgi:hypothetical protein
LLKHSEAVISAPVLPMIQLVAFHFLRLIQCSFLISSIIIAIIVVVVVVVVVVAAA